VRYPRVAIAVAVAEATLCLPSGDVVLLVLTRASYASCVSSCGLLAQRIALM